MIGALVSLVIYVLVLGLIIWLINYLIDIIPVPEPFAKIARILIIVVGVVIILMLLLSVVNDSAILPRFR